MALIVCSQPKAGTYFLAPLLAELGIPWSRIHVTPTGYIDHSKSTPQEIRAGGTLELCPLGKTLQKLGQRVAQGHLGPCEDLLRHKVVVIVRNGRSRLRSRIQMAGVGAFRFLESPSADLFVQQSKAVAEWWTSDHPVARFKFEDMLPAMTLHVLDDLAMITGRSLKDVMAAYHNVVGKDYGTLNPDQSHHGVLQPTTELWYQKHLAELDRFLGYSPEAGRLV